MKMISKSCIGEKIFSFFFRWKKKLKREFLICLKRKNSLKKNYIDDHNDWPSVFFLSLVVVVVAHYFHFSTLFIWSFDKLIIGFCSPTTNNNVFFSTSILYYPKPMMMMMVINFTWSSGVFFSFFRFDYHVYTCTAVIFFSGNGNLFCCCCWIEVIGE